MLSKNKIKYLNSLKDKKWRKAEKLFIAEGIKIVGELLKSNTPVHSIYANSEWLKENSRLINSQIELNEVSNEELQKISALTTAQSVLAVIPFADKKLEVGNLKSELILAVDNVKDPGNLGTIIRIADWFGIKNIVCSDSTVELYNPKVIQATMGSFLRVKVHFTDLPSFLNEYKKMFSENKIYSAVMDGENIYKKQVGEKGILIVGSESHGISEEVQRLGTDKILIPSYSSVFNPAGEEVESLNVAIATAIICSEFRRSGFSV